MTASTTEPTQINDAGRRSAKRRLPLTGCPVDGVRLAVRPDTRKAS